jgi:hypothetical protein
MENHPPGPLGQGSGSQDQESGVVGVRLVALLYLGISGSELQQCCAVRRFQGSNCICLIELACRAQALGERTYLLRPVQRSQGLFVLDTFRQEILLGDLAGHLRLPQLLTLQLEVKPGILHSIIDGCLSNLRLSLLDLPPGA